MRSNEDQEKMVKALQASPDLGSHELGRFIANEKKIPNEACRSPMKMICRTAVLSFAAFLFASCAQTEARTPIKAAPAGTHFDSVGKITLHQGQPCAPQVMFNLTAQFRKPVGLAARFHESRTLTEAARAGRRVHVSGVWRHGRNKECGYVEVTSVTAP